MQYTILVVQATAAIPFGSFEVTSVGVPFVILFYAVIFIATRLGIKRATGLFVARVWVSIALLALVTMFVWTTALASPDARTRITFIAASEGDATFIRTNRDERILINGTGDPSAVLSFLGTQLPPWDRRIVLVIATHLDDNPSSLNAVLERFNVGHILEPNAPALRKMDREKMLSGDVSSSAGVAILPNEFDKERLERITPSTVILFVGKIRVINRAWRR